MKNLTKMAFFRSLQKNENNLSILKSRYDKFAALLFSESATATDKVLFHNILVYTRIELLALEGLRVVLGKNAAIYLKKAFERVHIQVEWIERQVLAEQTAG
jgi:hypothetical protein